MQRTHYGAILPMDDATGDTAQFSTKAEAIAAAKADILAEQWGWSVHRYGAPD